MQLFFDANDLPDSEKLKDDRFQWLSEIGAKELGEAHRNDQGFLFGYQYNEERLEKQVGKYLGIHDRPEERQELVNIDDVLCKLKKHGVDVPTPKTWVLKIDQPLPGDLQFPLFLRCRKSSWKRGGEQGKVNNEQELHDESELLRRAFGWDAPIIARQWLNIAAAGKWMFGDAPQEIRTWIVDSEPIAWSFHYLHAVRQPNGFPPSPLDLQQIKSMAQKVAKPFRSRLVVADFVRDKNDQWHFMEAGAGAVAGTAHEQVFKYVANQLVDNEFDLTHDNVGGRL